MVTSFTEWDRNQWGTKLLRAVFSEKRGSGPVRTINASPAFLTSVVPSPPSDDSDVLSSFCQSFPSSPDQVRRLFDPRIHVPQDGVPADDEPDFFAQLYLSCVSASATKDTFNEGVFRKRLAELLSSPDKDYLTRYNRQGLPTLWRALADWSQRASHSGRSVRPLILPDPGHETIIGFSKQLAFPGYRDQRKLSRLIKTYDLGVDSPTERIIRIIGKHRSEFSQRFRHEYRDFRNNAKKGSVGSSNSRLWAAIEAVTWSPVDSSDNPTPSLELLLADTLPSPRIECLLQNAPSSLSGPGWHVEPVEPPLDDCTARILDNRGIPPIHPLLEGGDFGNEFQLGYLERLIDQGCVPFGPGRKLKWVSRRTLPAEGTGWLLVREEHLNPIWDLLSQQLSCENDINERALRKAPNWYVLGPIPCSDLPRRTSLSTPGTYDAFKSHLTGTRLRLRDAIRLDDGLLFLRPRFPKVACKEADTVQAFIGGQSSPITLTQSERDGIWYFPLSCNRDHSFPNRITFRALSENTVLDTRSADIIESCSVLEGEQDIPADGSYAFETDSGQLSPLTTSTVIQVTEDGETSVVAPAKDFRSKLQSVVSQEASRDTSTITVHSSTFDDVPRGWWDVLEVCLGLTISRKRGFSWQEFRDIVSDGFGVGGDSKSNQALRQILIQNGYIQEVFSLNSPAPRYFARRPSCVFLENRSELRIIGTLGRLRRTQLQSTTSDFSTTPTVTTLGDNQVFGVIRITDVTQEQSRNIASAIDARIVGGVPTCSIASPYELFSNVSPRVRLFEEPDDLTVWKLRQDTAFGSLAWQRREFSGEPHSYTLTLDEDPVWGTQSLRWARFVAHALTRDNLLAVSPDRSIHSLVAAPLAVSRRALLWGRGVCGCQWKQDTPSQWIYPFSDRHSTQQYLQGWLKQAPTLDTATERWITSFRGHRSRREAFTIRYENRIDR